VTTLPTVAKVINPYMGKEGSDDFTQRLGNVVIPTFLKKGVWMLAKAKNGHANIWELF
jgi:hypothetical protein